MITASGYISVSEFKFQNPHLDFTNYGDPVLSGMIRRATGQIDDILHYTLPIEDITNEKVSGAVNTFGDFEIWTQKFPIESLTTLKLVKGTAEVTLNLTQTSDGRLRYDIPTDNAPPAVYAGREFSSTSIGVSVGHLAHLGSSFFFKVDYRAGYETIPTPVKDATSALVKGFMAEQYNVGGFDELRQGQITLKREARNRFKEEALELVNKYIRVWS